MLLFKENKELIINYLDNYRRTTPTITARQGKDKAIRYYPTPCCLDIETTSAETEDNEKLAWMYEWTFAFGEDLVIYGRTWNEYKELIDILNNNLKLDKYKRIYIGVHNLSFEFQFMRKYFNWDKVFSNDERHPIQAISGGLEYHCTATISGYPLEELANNLTHHTINKLKGSLDYTKIRCSETPLTDEELAYCYNDVMIVIYYLEEQIELYGSVKDIPLTNTARTRNYCKEHTLYMTDCKNKRIFNGYYKRLMSELKLTPDTYYASKAAFRGGYVHCNPNYIGQTCYNIGSYDLTSAYLYEMVANKYPMSEFTETIPKNQTVFNYDLNEYACLMLITFKDLEMKAVDSYLSWIPSKMKGIDVNDNNNGRIVSAKEVKLWLTEIDYKIMKQTYNWSGIKLHKMYIAKKGYLPKDLIMCVLELYKNKTIYKDDLSHKMEYMNSKALANSIYGLTIQEINKVVNAYDNTNGWHPEYPNIKDRLFNYNKSINRFTYYPWGVWISAYCRYTLWHGILEAGEDYRYSDTDSVKLANVDKHSQWFEDYNNKMIAKLKQTLKYFHISEDYIFPCTAQGEIKTLGVWEYEGTYDEFKSLGAKKYITRTNGKAQITVAGLNKKAVEYITQLNPNDPLNEFNELLEIPAKYSGRLVHTFIDEPFEYDVDDYTGQRCTISQLSGVHLSTTSYSFNIEDEFMEWLTNNIIYGGK